MIYKLEYNDGEESDDSKETLVESQETKSPAIKPRDNRSTKVHWDTFIEFFAKHPGLPAGTLGRTEARKLWIELADLLNQVGSEYRSMEKWQKAWVDFKYTLKKKIKKYKEPDLLTQRLNDYEVRVLDIMGWNDFNDKPESSEFEIQFENVEAVDNDTDFNNYADQPDPIHDVYIITEENATLSNTSTLKRPLEDNSNNNNKIKRSKLLKIKKECELESEERNTQQQSFISIETINVLKDIYQSIDNRLSAVERSVTEVRQSIENLTAAIAPSLRTIATAASAMCSKK